MSRRVWKVVEAETGKSRVAKSKRRRSKRGGREEKRRKGIRESRKIKKKRKMISVKRVAEKWEIWDDEEEAAKSEAETKKLVPEKFHR